MAVSDTLPASVHFDSASVTAGSGSCTRTSSGPPMTKGGTITRTAGSLAAGVRPDGAVPLGLDLAFGGNPLRVVAAELWELATGPLLTLRLDLGPRRQGRLLLGPGQVRVDGEDRGFRGRWAGLGHTRYETIDVPLPLETPDVVSVTLRLKRVEILGPWIVPLGF